MILSVARMAEHRKIFHWFAPQVVIAIVMNLEVIGRCAELAAVSGMTC